MEQFGGRNNDEPVELVEIAAGQNHSCARLTDGSVKCWGSNAYGLLGDNTTTDRHTPVAVQGISNATAITAGDFHNCARLTDGSVKCWGYNGLGQLGDNTTIHRHTPGDGVVKTVKACVLQSIPKKAANSLNLSRQETLARSTIC